MTQTEGIKKSNLLALLWLAGVGIVLVLVPTSGTAEHQPIAAAESAVEISLQTFLTDLNKPVNLISSGVTGDGRLFIVEQSGKILIANADGMLRNTPFLDITGRVDQTANRTGLFGLAFHPNYESNGYFYVHYIHREGDFRISRLSRFEVTANDNVADPNSENILLTVTKTHPGHNAGDIHFGADGYLYFPLGDGDSSMITDRPQDPATLLGKMVRINVNDNPNEGAADCKGAGSGDYSIPPSNPFAGSNSACDEIWASGLRNPWRFSFDRLSGNLYLTDVGEARWDELNFLAQGAAGGQNYGWPCYEADIPFEPEQWAERLCESGTDFTFPDLPVAIGDGDCSVTGGYVYRGSRYPELVGRYLMTDYCSGVFRDVVRNGNNWTVTRHNIEVSFGIVSFGEGNDGELYVVNRESNTIYRLVGEEGSATATFTPTPKTSTATPTPPTPSSTQPSGSTITPTPDSPTPPPTEPGETRSPTITPSVTTTTMPTTLTATLPGPSPTFTRPPVWVAQYFLPVVLEE